MQGSLVCCSPWYHKKSHMTELLNWTELTGWHIPNTYASHFCHIIVLLSKHVFLLKTHYCFLLLRVEICYFLHQDISYLFWNFFSSSFIYLVPSNNAMFSLDSTQENHKVLAQDFSSWLTRADPLDFWTWHQVFCHWYFFSDRSFTLGSINGSVFVNVI